MRTAGSLRPGCRSPTGLVGGQRSRSAAEAGRSATFQVGGRGRAVSDVAPELGADWHAINDAVIAYGTALLDADEARVGAVEALGVDEVLSARVGPWRTQAWSTSIVDVAAGQLLDVIAGRSAAGYGIPIGWTIDGANRNDSVLLAPALDDAPVSLDYFPAGCATSSSPGTGHSRERYTFV
jgi:hypothetical protein